MNAPLSLCCIRGRAWGWNGARLLAPAATPTLHERDYLSAAAAAAGGGGDGERSFDATVCDFCCTARALLSAGGNDSQMPHETPSPCIM